MRLGNFSLILWSRKQGIVLDIFKYNGRRTATKTLCAFYFNRKSPKSKLYLRLVLFEKYFILTITNNWRIKFTTRPDRTDYEQ